MFFGNPYVFYSFPYPMEHSQCPIFTYQEPLVQSLKEKPKLENQSENFYEIFKRELLNRKRTFNKKVWKEQEDNILIALRNASWTWEEISHRILKTNAEICKRRFVKLTNQDPKWTKQEDQTIKNLKQNENMSWGQISSVVRKHSIKQIRERYENYLRQGIDTSEWGIEQDVAIMRFVRSIGKKWKKLSMQLKHRTEIQLKNRYYGTLSCIQKKILKQMRQ